MSLKPIPKKLLDFVRKQIDDGKLHPDRFYIVDGFPSRKLGEGKRFLLLNEDKDYHRHIPIPFRILKSDIDFLQEKGYILYSRSTSSGSYSESYTCALTERAYDAVDSNFDEPDRSTPSNLPQDTAFLKNSQYITLLLFAFRLFTLRKPMPHLNEKSCDSSIKKIKIFLASSSELKDDRDQFEIFIRRKNDELIDRFIYLQPVRWENFIDAMSAEGLQEEYNKAVAESDIFVSLFYTKVGRYTEEEFSRAFGTFQENNKPLVYTYFQEKPTSPSLIDPSLHKFKEKLKELKHYPTYYHDINDLKHQFGEQLNKILPKI